MADFSLVDAWIRKLKNHPLIAALVVASIIISGTVSFWKSLTDLTEIFKRSPSLAPLSVTYDSIQTYRGLYIQKPSSWFLVNDGEHPTFSVENPEDPSVYITVFPNDVIDYEAVEGVQCKFLRDISAGSVGPEADGMAPLKKCNYTNDGQLYEELVLFIRGRMEYAVRCGYSIDKALMYRTICNTVVGTARYRSE